MNRILTSPFSLIALLFIIIAGAWAAYLPNFVAGRVHEIISQQTGRDVLIRGGAGLVISPRFGVALYEVEMAGSYALAKPVVQVKTLIVPIGFSTLISGQFATDTFSLDDADIAVVMNAEGHSNVAIEINPVAAKEDANAATKQPVKLTLSNSRFHFSDERDGTAFNLTNAGGLVQISGDGELNFDGTAAAKEQFMEINASLHSLARMFEDGSPIDINVAGAAGSVSFNGQIATKGSLNLAGQADVSAADTQAFAHWLGVNFDGLFKNQKFILSGAVETNGANIQFKNAELQLADMHGKGNLTFATSEERPKFSALLGFDIIDLTQFLPTPDANDSWSEKPFSTANFSALDFDFSLSSNRIIYNGMQTGPATIAANLSNQHVKASLKSQAIGNGAGEVSLDIDVAQRPFKLQAELNFSDVEAQDVLRPLFGINFISGPTSLSAVFSSLGESSAEFISNLSGDGNGELKNGTVRGVDLSRLSGVESEGWPGTSTSAVNARFKATFKNGVAKLTESKIEGSGYSIPIEGEVDLLRQSLDVTTNAKFKIVGPWLRPKIFPDLASVVKNKTP